MLQSAFVLCRLFKKQDESVEIEPSESSPTSGKSGFALDQTLPERKPSVSHLSEKATFNLQAPVECQTKSLELTATEVINMCSISIILFYFIFSIFFIMSNVM